MGATAKMAYETTIITLAVIVITAVVAWYFRVFEKKSDDIDMGDEDFSMEALQEKMRALNPEEADNYGGSVENDDGTLRYKWEQDNDNTVVIVPVDEGVGKKQIKFELGVKNLKLVIQGNTILEGRPYRKVRHEDSIWEFDEDEKTGQKLFRWNLVKLNKTEGRKHWKCVVRGEPEIDTHRFGSALQTVNPNDPAGMAAMVAGLKDDNDSDS